MLASSTYLSRNHHHASQLSNSMQFEQSVTIRTVHLRPRRRNNPGHLQPIACDVSSRSCDQHDMASPGGRRAVTVTAARSAYQSRQHDHASPLPASMQLEQAPAVSSKIDPYCCTPGPWAIWRGSTDPSGAAVASVPIRSWQVQARARSMKRGIATVRMAMTIRVRKRIGV
jgi:hypothetical protein